MKHFSTDLGRLMSLSLTQEPEVARKTLGRIRCRSLAQIVTKLINENEPLLHAEVDGPVVTVRERGALGAGMTFTVQEGLTS